MMEAIVIIGAGLALFLVVRTVARWAVRRDIARCEQRRAERERETLARYRSHTIPGRRAATSESSSPSTSTTPSVWDAFAPAPRDADPVPAVPHVYSSPSCIHMKNAPDAEPCSQCTGYSHYEPVGVHEPENHPKGEG